ncbi:MAG: hypothetical protein WCR83_06700 [Candidatus Methanomethylophilaceae archaeon]
MIHPPDVCLLKENYHCAALRGNPADLQTIRLVVECNTKGCNLANNILNNPRDVFGGRFIGSVEHFGDKQDAPLLLVHDKMLAKA